MGIFQFGTTKTLSGEEMVSPVSAVVSFGSITISPAMADAWGFSSVPTARWMTPILSSSSWSRSFSSSATSSKNERCPDTWTTSSVRSVPEKIRTIESRPANGSVVVRITWATSGAAGSDGAGGCSSPVSFTGWGFGWRLGVGKPCSMRLNSSSVPRPLDCTTGTTGNRLAPAVAFIRSSSSLSRPGSSPSR